LRLTNERRDRGSPNGPRRAIEPRGAADTAALIVDGYVVRASWRHPSRGSTSYEGAEATGTFQPPGAYGSLDRDGVTWRCGNRHARRGRPPDAVGYGTRRRCQQGASEGRPHHASLARGGVYRRPAFVHGVYAVQPGVQSALGRYSTPFHMISAVRKSYTTATPHAPYQKRKDTALPPGCNTVPSWRAPPAGPTPGLLPCTALETPGRAGLNTDTDFDFNGAWSGPGSRVVTSRQSCTVAPRTLRSTLDARHSAPAR